MNASMMKLTLAKNAPHIAVVAGIGAVVASTIWCCHATLKVDELLEESRARFDKIKDGKEELGEAYSSHDFHADMVKAYVKSAADFAKLYGPPIALGLAGLAAILYSHHTMSRRCTALMGAYTLLQDRFAKYRDTAEAVLGPDTERDIFDGVTREVKTIKEKDEEGNVQKREEVNRIPNTDELDGFLSEYAWLFCKDTSNMAMGNYNDDLYFLQVAQAEMNDRLLSHGHVFLNEVYERLGFEHTSEGAVVGWVFKEGAENHIDFGVFDGKASCMRRVQDGLTYGGIALDFNVDGVIYDLI